MLVLSDTAEDNVFCISTNAALAADNLFKDSMVLILIVMSYRSVARASTSLLNSRNPPTLSKNDSGATIFESCLTLSTMQFFQSFLGMCHLGKLLDT